MRLNRKWHQEKVQLGHHNDRWLGRVWLVIVHWVLAPLPPSYHLCVSITTTPFSTMEWLSRVWLVIIHWTFPARCDRRVAPQLCSWFGGWEDQFFRTLPLRWPSSMISVAAYIDLAFLGNSDLLKQWLLFVTCQWLLKRERRSNKTHLTRIWRVGNQPTNWNVMKINNLQENFIQNTISLSPPLPLSTTWTRLNGQNKETPPNPCLLPNMATDRHILWYHADSV